MLFEVDLRTSSGNLPAALVGSVERFIGSMGNLLCQFLRKWRRDTSTLVYQERTDISGYIKQWTYLPHEGAAEVSKNKVWNSIGWKVGRFQIQLLWSTSTDLSNELTN